MSGAVARARTVRPRLTVLTAHGHDHAWLRRHARAVDAGGEVHVSRSYCHPYAVVAAHGAPVGVDIERLEPDDPGLLESIGTPAERAMIASIRSSSASSAQ